MFKGFRRSFWRGVTVVFAVLAGLTAQPQRAEAFGGTAEFRNVSLGGCSIYAAIDVETQAYVNIPAAAQLAGGRLFNFGSIVIVDPISAAGLAQCGITEVTDLVQNGADGTITSDDYIGFSFRGRDQDGLVYDYEIALVGATETTIVATKTAALVNTPPTADAGPDLTIASGEFFSLNGAGSDADEDTLLYDWTWPSFYLPADAQNIGTNAPVLLPGGQDEQYTITLTVSDGTDTATDTMVLTVKAPPVSTDAGLSALSLSDGVLSPAFDTEVAAYTASVSNDVASVVVTPTLSDSGASATVNGSPSSPINLAVGANSIAVEVTAQDGTTKTTYIVTVTRAAPVNQAPEAEAGYFADGSAVTLNSEGSTDPDGDELTYSWEQTDGPSVILSGANTASPNFVGAVLGPNDDEVTYLFRLTVSDGALSSETEISVTIFPRRVLADPEAVATVVGKTPVDGKYEVTSGELVTLTAEGSTGFDDEELGYFWETESAGVTLSSTDEETTSFTAPDVTEPTDVAVSLTIGAVLKKPTAILNDLAIDLDDGDAPPTVVVTITVMPADITTDAETQAEIEAAERNVQTFIQTRSSVLLTTQPDLGDAVGGGTSEGSANLTVSSMGGQADIATAPDQPVWLRLKGSWSTVDGAEGDYILGSVGSHVMAGEGFALGVMAQVDHLKTVDGLSVSEGTGWLVGPYAVVRLKNHPVTVQGRLLYGKTDNTLSPFGTFEDSFKGDRLLAQIGMSGEIARGEVIWKPALTAGYVQETTEAYVNGAGTPVGAQKTAMAQVAPGFEVSFPVAVASGSLRLSLGVSDVWSGSVSGPASSFEGHRGRISAGMKRVLSSGATLSATTIYDGIGTPTYETMSVDVMFEHRF